MIESQFVDLAKSIGVANKIAALIVDVDQAIAKIDQSADPRWLWRLEAQRRLLQDPPLRTLVALSTRLVEENPALASVVAPALGELAQRHREFAPFHARVTASFAAGAPVERRHAG